MKEIVRVFMIGVWICAALLLPVAFIQAQNIYYRLVPPHQVPAAGLLSEPTDSEDLNVWYEVKRNRICQMNLNWFVRDENNRTMLRVEAPGGAQPPGYYPRVLNNVPGTAKLPHGCYLLHTQIHNNCIEGTHSIETPTIKFCHR